MCGTSMPARGKKHSSESSDKWIQKAHVKKGALHKQLGYSLKKNIPKGVIQRIAKTKVGNRVQIKGKSRIVTDLLKKRAVFAYDLERYPKIKS